METPPLLKGYLYSSSRVFRCPRFHACIVTKKCQNYDKHQLDCVNCEKAVDPPVDLGGHLPEGEYYPDIQASTKIVQDALQKAMAHPDQETQKMNVDVADEYSKVKKATDMLHENMNKGVLQIEDELASETGVTRL